MKSKPGNVGLNYLKYEIMLVKKKKGTPILPEALLTGMYKLLLAN